MTIDDLRKNVERQFMISQVQREEVGSKLTITEEEARQYYPHIRRSSPTQANVTLREILVEIADRDTGRPGRRQRGAGRRSAREGDCDPRAHPGGRGFRQGGRRKCRRRASKATGGLIGPINVSELSDVAAEDC